MGYDWSRFSVTSFYAAPLERVFRAWATPTGLESFFVREAIFTSEGARRDPEEIVRPGDEYEWRYAQPFEHGGRVLAVEENDRVVFTFGPMEVEVTLRDVGDAVRVDLRQTNIPETEDGREGGHLNCRSCWVYFMTNLKSVLEQGVDLRELDRPDRAMAIEVGFPRT